MPNMSAWLTSTALGACLLLAACGGGDQATPNFAPPDYSYLSKLRLNVGTLAIEDHAAQAGDPNDLGPTAPVPPDQALQQMARDRLVAAGNSASAIFTIDQASIIGSGGGALDGHLAVHLDIMTANGGHAGYAEAHVSRQFVPGAATPDDGTRAQLYSLTQQMMQDMNVELEYQVQRSLRDWLVDASGAPVAGSVEQQTLAPPGMGGTSTPSTSTPSSGTPVGTTPVGAVPLGSGASAPTALAPTALAPTALAPDAPAPTAPASTGGPLPLAPPQAVPDAGTQDPAAPVRSPPAGFLQPPAGSAPATPPAANGY